MFLSPGSRAGRGAVPLAMDRCEIYLSTALITAGTSFIKVPMDAALYDPYYLFDATRQVIVPRRPGLYLINSRVRLTSTAAFDCFLGFNGSAIKGLGPSIGSGSWQASGGSANIYCNGTTDFLTTMIFISTSKTYTNGAFDTFMEVQGPL